MVLPQEDNVTFSIYTQCCHGFTEGVTYAVLFKIAEKPKILCNCDISIQAWEIEREIW